MSLSINDSANPTSAYKSEEYTPNEREYRLGPLHTFFAKHLQLFADSKIHTPDAIITFDNLVFILGRNVPDFVEKGNRDDTKIIEISTGTKHDLVLDFVW